MTDRDNKAVKSEETSQFGEGFNNSAAPKAVNPVVAIMDFTREVLYDQFTSSNPVITTTRDPAMLAGDIHIVISTDLVRSSDSIPDPDALKTLQVVNQNGISIEVFPKGTPLYRQLTKLAAERREAAPQFDR